jgi:hypothetical protein
VGESFYTLKIFLDMKVFFHEKWPKIEKNSFLGIKIDLQLGFNLKKMS